MTCLSHTPRKWWSHSLNQSMSDSHAQTINYHDSEKFREPKPAFLGMVAFKESIEEKESRKDTGKERPERSE